MFRPLAALIIVCALIWQPVAYAACITEDQCDGAGNCSQVQICDAVRDIVQSPANSATALAEKPDALAPAHVAAALEEAAPNCRKVDICGTTQLVCD